QVRSFIAIELPDELKLRLARLQAQLKLGEPYSVKWVDPESIHLTLKFLGYVVADKIIDINGAMQKACQGISPFNLEVKELGVFPNLRRVQVAWVGMSGQIDRLCQLQQKIESSLAPLGFAPESRRFTPHLTLARLRERASLDERQRFGQLIADTGFEEIFTFEVDAISLMSSQLTRGGAIYSRINLVGLK
ncbi:RNA 2',3'-cyclic phosphodiesterase, partial [Chloroflexota bacterium]